MPRKERALDTGDNPLLQFATDLRGLRESAGRPPYRELARRAHFSAAALCDAAGGRKLPSLAVTTAYVRACGGQVAEWERRWHSLTAELPMSQPQASQPPASRLSAFRGTALTGLSGAVSRWFASFVGGLLVRVGAAMVKASGERAEHSG